MTAAPDDAPGILRTDFIESALQGAHLVAARTASGDPLFLSRRAVFAPGKAVRGGVPIIFPWFGDAPGLGAHGFARTSAWREVARTDSGDGLVLELTDSKQTRALWPHPFRLRFEVRVDASLHMALEVTNTGSEPFDYEVALHSYFTVSDVTQVLVHGLEDARYIDKPTGFTPCRQGDEPIAFDSEIDRVYNANDAVVRIEDPLGERTIEVAKSEANSTIVWNPGPKRASTMADLRDDWNRFVCVESGNVGDDARTLPPGASERIEVMVTIDARH